MANNQSINFAAQQSIHIQKPVTIPFNNFSNQKSLGKPRQLNFTGRCMNVVSPHKNSGKLTVNPQFEQYLSFDNANPSMISVGMMGPRKIGKSFILDNILTFQTGQICRVMSKNRDELINTSTIISTNHKGQRIIYFDSVGSPSPSIFIWMYYLCNVIVYNLSPSNDNEETDLLQCLIYTHNNIRTKNDEVQKPRLIILRRDVSSKQIFDFDLIRKIEELQLFSPQIIVLHLPYPGNKNVMAKQLLDVPMRQLNPNFLQQVNKLHQIIRSSRPKRINNYALTPQIMKMILQPLTKGVNNQQNISTKKIWSQVYQSLSIAYYNNYLKNYSQQLQKQFESEQPCDKYTIYKRLTKIRRKVNRKMQRYNSITDEPTFQKYKQKLDQTIKKKEELVKSVNSEKSKEVHLKNYNRLLQNMNENNYRQLIDNYCKNSLDDQKTEVLVQNFQKILYKRQEFVNNSNGVSPRIQNNIYNDPPKIGKSPVKIQKQVRQYEPSQQLIKINKDLQQIQKAIIIRSKIPNAPNLDQYKSTIESKKLQLQALKEQAQKLANNAPFILSQQPQHEQLTQLQEQRQRLNQCIGNQQKQISILKRKKETLIQQPVLRLQEELRRQQQNLKRLKASTIGQPAQVPYRSKILSAENNKKNTCCLIM